MNVHKRADSQTDRQTDRQTDKQSEWHCKLSRWKKGNEDEQIMLSVGH